jgi:hypothetical protein
MKYWVKAGAFWGGFSELLFGSVFFMIPGLGPILAAGAIVTWIVGALEGAALVGGESALGAGLYSVGIPEGGIAKYAAIKTDRFLLIVNGTVAKVKKAKKIITESTHPDRCLLHPALAAKAAAL